MIVSKKILEKDFIGKDKKEAYLKCCKWLSKNIIAKDNSEHFVYKIQKVEKNGCVMAIRLLLYVSIEEEEARERNCNICREVSSSFFMKSNKYMCETCKLLPYIKRITEKLEGIEKAMKGKIGL